MIDQLSSERKASNDQHDLRDRRGARAPDRSGSRARPRARPAAARRMRVHDRRFRVRAVCTAASVARAANHAYVSASPSASEMRGVQPSTVARLVRAMNEWSCSPGRFGANSIGDVDRPLRQAAHRPARAPTSRFPGADVERAVVEPAAAGASFVVAARNVASATSRTWT